MIAWTSAGDMPQDPGVVTVQIIGWSALGAGVLAGIAASDAICGAAVGERYAGQDHTAAVKVLNRVDAQLARKLKSLADMKPGSHYGDALLTASDRDRAIKAATDLVHAAAERT
jgi:hypothetical protein